MLDESDGYTYQGKVFASREAMELFIASRAPVDVRTVGARPSRGVGFGWVAAGFAALLLGMCSLMSQADKPAAQAGPAPSVAGTAELDDDVSGKAALVINASGQLCAKVTSITRIQGDLYDVVCVRYRDGTGTASYEMNAATGAVR